MRPLNYTKFELYLYLQKLSIDNELPLQMRREINQQINRCLLNFEYKVDDQGVKPFYYYDLWIDLKLLKWKIASNSSKTILMPILKKSLNHGTNRSRSSSM